MNSLPSRAAVQQEMERICSTNKTTHTIQQGELHSSCVCKLSITPACQQRSTLLEVQQCGAAFNRLLLHV